jgi:hypothetical protein
VHRRGARVGRQRVRHGDQLPGAAKRACRGPGAGGGLRRGNVAPRRGIRLHQGRLSPARRGGPAARPALREGDLPRSGHRAAGGDRARMPLHVARLPRGPDRSKPREPRPRNDRPLLPAQHRDAARGDRPRGLSGAADSRRRDARAGGRRRQDRILGPGDLERPAGSAGASRAPLAGAHARPGGEGRRTFSSLPRRPASLQSRHGSRGGVSVPGDGRREGPRARGGRCPRDRRVRLELAGAGQARRGARRQDRGGVPGGRIVGAPGPPVRPIGSGPDGGSGRRVQSGACRRRLRPRGRASGRRGKAVLGLHFRASAAWA